MAGVQWEIKNPDDPKGAHARIDRDDFLYASVFAQGAGRFYYSLGAYGGGFASGGSRSGFLLNSGTIEANDIYAALEIINGKYKKLIDDQCAILKKAVADLDDPVKKSLRYSSARRNYQLAKRREIARRKRIRY